MEMRQLQEAEKIPDIVLPGDLTPDRQARLAAKLAEYRKRESDHYFLAAESLFDTICKIAVLDPVLNSGRVSPSDLYRELGERYGFCPELMKAFVNACNVIEDYIATGGQKVDNASRPFAEIPV